MNITIDSIIENVFENTWEEFEGEHPGYGYLLDVIDNLASELYHDEGMKPGPYDLEDIQEGVLKLWEEAV